MYLAVVQHGRPDEAHGKGDEGLRERLYRLGALVPAAAHQGSRHCCEGRRLPGVQAVHGLAYQERACTLYNAHLLRLICTKALWSSLTAR